MREGATVRKAEAGNRLIQVWVKDRRGDRWVGGLRGQAGKNSDFIQAMELVENGFDQGQAGCGVHRGKRGSWQDAGDGEL